MAKKNTYPAVVSKPTGKVGGTNKELKTITKPTGRVGGTNAPAKVKCKK